MTCQYLINTNCLIASNLAETACPVTEDQCNYCTNYADPPQFRNVVTLSIALKHTKDKRSFLNQYGSVLEEKHDGTSPGTKLKNLISWFVWSKEARDCTNCKNREDTMNQWGAAKCERNIEIIVGWLRESAQQHNIPFSERIARAFIRKAIAE